MGDGLLAKLESFSFLILIFLARFVKTFFFLSSHSFAASSFSILKAFFPIQVPSIPFVFDFFSLLIYRHLLFNIFEDYYLFINSSPSTVFILFPFFFFYFWNFFLLQLNFFYLPPSSSSIFIPFLLFLLLSFLFYIRFFTFSFAIFLLHQSILLLRSIFLFSSSSLISFLFLSFPPPFYHFHPLLSLLPFSFFFFCYSISSSSSSSLLLFLHLNVSFLWSVYIFLFLLCLQLFLFFFLSFPSFPFIYFLLLSLFNLLHLFHFLSPLSILLSYLPPCSSPIIFSYLQFCYFFLSCRLLLSFPFVSYCSPHFILLPLFFRHPLSSDSFSAVAPFFSYLCFSLSSSPSSSFLFHFFLSSSFFFHSFFLCSQVRPDTRW
ncbi:unnamed protein product [Acanthosepion pharaonis]|uniref:Uncharacterized protein n=1 Tax=Acanthosepion pharaonis TaxID=158019 RepID=A0A812EE23_ACAPH|nr:unnamed protein product [Sepia pharaonis]